MKILFINDYTRTIGGCENYIKNAQNHLERKGHETKLFGYSGPPNRIFSLFKRCFNIFSYYSVLKQIKNFNPDIVHVHNISRQVSPSVVLAAKKYHKPVVMTLHDFYYLCPRLWMIYKDNKPCRINSRFQCLFSKCYSNKPGYLYQPYYWFIFFQIKVQKMILKNNVDMFISPSKYLLNHVKDDFKIDNINYLPNFVDIKLNKNSKQANYLLYVGRISKEKGLDFLIRATPKILETNPDYKLKIVGDGPDIDNLKLLTKKLEVSSNIEFLGYLKGNKLEDLFNNCLATIIPSLCVENNPLLVLESMGYGKPILGSNLGGIKEVINDSKNGLLTKPGDSKDLAESIVKILSNPIFAKQMGENARKTYENKFTSEKHIEKLEMLYTQIIKNYN